jgi:hypothetical protein
LLRLAVFLLLRVGKRLRLLRAILRNSLSLIDEAIWRDAPLSDERERFPRLADNAAPAAICCFFDLAGMPEPSAP